ncbi:sensor histidine kinase [Micromonospora carbonacea]|uniref:histidine kinase n=1 Tax=Micromonospora carbonacea TaxID=47853 RepID=A0A7H8XPB8_9ACTN|nr:histidine kinase [Micromonospora carbonacea]MBB5825022.1 signal transduction histidine kinase [Micromonospora carbonacea]QLD26867.1 sensor histidine kinase [Micromonospora carbonacea]
MRLPPWLRPGATGRDLALAGVALAGGLALLGLGTHLAITPRPGVPTVAFLPSLVAVSAAVALRRVATRTGLALGTAALGVDVALGTTLGTALIYTQVLYDSCVYGPPRLRRWLLRVTVALSLLAAVGGVLVFGHWRGVALGVPVVLVGVVPVLTGISVRQYRDQAAAERARAAEERARAEQTARLAELDRREAVHAERSRMARELHDVVANHLSAVAIHATAALSVPGLDREQVASSLRVIRENSVQGLAEMRQLIGLLREPTTGDGPAPGDAGKAAEEATRVRLAELDRLVGRMRSAGLDVRTEVTGGARPLPVGVDLAAYRIVQESLTNALKHGAGEAELVVTYGPTEVVVAVTNPLRAGGAAAPGAGAGLVGMRERAVLLGGGFTAGPADGRWRVRARLPTGEPA